jgi:predicted transcriptional regulator
MLKVMHEQETCTTKDIHEKLQVNLHRISSTITKWMNDKKGYIERLDKKIILPNGRWYYQYVLTEKGEQTYDDFKRRIDSKQCIDVSENSIRPKKRFIGVNIHGQSAGLDEKEALKKAGLTKR